MNAIQEQTEDLTLIDGVYYNEDGEAVRGEWPKSDHPDSETAEWVMERILNLDADLARHDIKARAITENLANQRREIENRRKGLLWRFTPTLENFARRELEGKKTKTLKTLFGKLSFRTKAQSYEWDKEGLLAWAKENAPEAVKTTESVLVSVLSDEQKELALNDGLATIKPAEEVFDIKTGVGS